MAKSMRAQRVRDAAHSASENPYLRRLIEDEELRRNIRGAFESARSAYARMNGKGPASALEDKKVNRDLREAAAELREASERIRGRRRSRPWGKLLLIAIVGAVLAIALNEGLRKALLDRVFGAEEEFEYTSTTVTVPPEPETAETAAAEGS
jgi:hypothetical protein